MFYVNNDNNIENLFRDAADKYPLKTEGASDWEKVSAALQKEPGVPFADSGNFKKGKKRRFFIWWILLFPLGWIGHESWQELNTTKEKIAVVGFRNNQASSIKDDETLMQSITPSKKEINDASKNSLITENKIEQSIRTDQQKNNFKKEIETTERKNLSLGEKRTDHQKNIASLVKRSQPFSEKNTPNITDNNEIKDEPTNNTLKNSDQISKDISAASPKKNIEQDNRTISKKDNEIKNKTFETSTVIENKNQAKPTTSLQRNRQFYVALMAGLDASTIKFQSVKGTGNSICILFGYHFSKTRFNIETGLFWDTKKYYTDGEYVDGNKLGYTQNIKIESLNGTCNMFEIPVNVRYNVIRKKNATLFAIAGLSSYLMHKESYGYEYEGNGWWGSGTSLYYHSTQNWFSIVNLSIGYEHQLGKIGTLRIEPYAKLPLSGIGKGSLYIMSGGLNVGLSKLF